MRALLITLSIVAFALQSQAQTYIYASEREYCAYNPSTTEFDKCESWEDHTLFVIDSRETKFEHFTDDVNSTYYIDSKEWNDEMEMNLWNVTSNAGNKYVYVVNLDNNAIAVLHDDGDNSFIVTFTIKKYWKK